jgi:hypothetical protein
MNDEKAEPATMSQVENALRKYTAEEFEAWGKADAFAAGYAEGLKLSDTAALHKAQEELRKARSEAWDADRHWKA